MALTLSPQVFAIVARLIEEKMGLHYELTNHDTLAEKLSNRASELGLSSLLDYYYYLRYDSNGEGELRILGETLVIQETYLFREIDPLRVLVSSVLPDVVRARGRARVWSAACATGEEPYTLAMLLYAANLLDRVDIVASDLSERALAKARVGVYSGRSLRSLSSAADAGQLLEKAEGGLQVRSDVRAQISWHRINLIDAQPARELGIFDVILCRNVLIYFAEETIGNVAGKLGDALCRGGLLVVGASESLLRFGTLFACEERGGSFFYRKVHE